MQKKLRSSQARKLSKYRDKFYSLYEHKEEIAKTTIISHDAELIDFELIAHAKGAGNTLRVSTKGCPDSYVAVELSDKRFTKLADWFRDSRSVLGLVRQGWEDDEKRLLKKINKLGGL